MRICLPLALISLLPLLQPQITYAKPLPTPLNVAESTLLAAKSPQNPITVEAYWPKSIKRTTLRYAVAPTYRVNCVTYLRSKGYTVPRIPAIAAITMKVDSMELPPEGQVVVIKTTDGPIGHVAAAVNKGGKLIRVADSAFTSGSQVPLEKYRGYVKPAPKPPAPAPKPPAPKN